MKFTKMVIIVPVELHVSYCAEPGKKRELLAAVRRYALEIPYEVTSAGINGAYSIRRKVKGKYR